MNRNINLSPVEYRQMAEIGLICRTYGDVIAEMMVAYRIHIEPQYRPERKPTGHDWRYKISDMRRDIHDGWIRMKWSDCIYADEREAILGAVDRIKELNWLNE